MKYAAVKKCFLTAIFLGLFGLALPALAANIRSMALPEQQIALHPPLPPDSLCQEAASENTHPNSRLQFRKMKKETLEKKPGTRSTQHLPFNFLYYLFYKFGLNDFFK